MNNLVQFLTLQRVEDDHVVNSIQKLGRKVDLEIELDLREFFSVEYFTAYNFYKKNIKPLTIIPS